MYFVVCCCHFYVFKISVYACKWFSLFSVFFFFFCLAKIKQIEIQLITNRIIFNRALKYLVVCARACRFPKGVCSKFYKYGVHIAAKHWKRAQVQCETVVLFRIGWNQQQYTQTQTNIYREREHWETLNANCGLLLYRSKYG